MNAQTKKNPLKTMLVAGALAASMFVSASSASALTSVDAGAEWLNQGPITQYPSSGGTWEYGFWNVKVRSYYTVNRCHGSSVSLNGNTARSADTASGKKSIAEKSAVNYWGNNDAYHYRVC